MNETNRTYSIKNVGNTLISQNLLAVELAQYSWTICTGFQIGDFLFLNDAFSEDGAQEYAVYKHDRLTGLSKKIESVTISWMHQDDIEIFIKRLPEIDAFPNAEPIKLSLEHYQDHHCHLCA